MRTMRWLSRPMAFAVAAASALCAATALGQAAPAGPRPATEEQPP